MKKFTILLIAFFLVCSLFGVQKTEAATTTTQPSDFELLVMSHLVYSSIDGAGAKTGMTVKDVLTSTKSPYTTVTKAFKKDLKSDGLNLNTVIQKAKLSQWYIYNFTHNPITGFFGVIFKNKVTGKFVVAFRGTSVKSITDLYTDVTLATSKYEPMQFEGARTLMRKLPSVSSKDIILTGHSLGGYHAARMGAGRDYRTVTFNAPGFSSKYFNSLKNSGAFKYANAVTNYNISADYVSASGKQIGKTKVFKSNWKWTAVKIHSLNTFYEFIR